MNEVTGSKPKITHRYFASYNTTSALKNTVVCHGVCVAKTKMFENSKFRAQMRRLQCTGFREKHVFLGNAVLAVNAAVRNNKDVHDPDSKAYGKASADDWRIKNTQAFKIFNNHKSSRAVKYVTQLTLMEDIPANRSFNELYYQMLVEILIRYLGSTKDALLKEISELLQSYYQTEDFANIDKDRLFSLRHANLDKIIDALLQKYQSINNETSQNFKEEFDKEVAKYLKRLKRQIKEQNNNELPSAYDENDAFRKALHGSISEIAGIMAYLKLNNIQKFVYPGPEAAPFKLCRIQILQGIFAHELEWLQISLHKTKHTNASQARPNHNPDEKQKSHQTMAAAAASPQFAAALVMETPETSPLSSQDSNSTSSSSSEDDGTRKKSSNSTASSIAAAAAVYDPFLALGRHCAELVWSSDETPKDKAELLGVMLRTAAIDKRPSIPKEGREKEVASAATARPLEIPLSKSPPRPQPRPIHDYNHDARIAAAAAASPVSPTMFKTSYEQPLTSVAAASTAETHAVVGASRPQSSVPIHKEGRVTGSNGSREKYSVNSITHLTDADDTAESSTSRAANGEFNIRKLSTSAPTLK